MAGDADALAPRARRVLLYHVYIFARTWSTTSGRWLYVCTTSASSYISAPRTQTAGSLAVSSVFHRGGPSTPLSKEGESDVWVGMERRDVEVSSFRPFYHANVDEGRVLDDHGFTDYSDSQLLVVKSVDLNAGTCVQALYSAPSTQSVVATPKAYLSDTTSVAQGRMRECSTIDVMVDQVGAIGAVFVEGILATPPTDDGRFQSPPSTEVSIAPSRHILLSVDGSALSGGWKRLSSVSCRVVLEVNRLVDVAGDRVNAARGASSSSASSSSTNVVGTVKYAIGEVTFDSTTEGRCVPLNDNGKVTFVACIPPCSNPAIMGALTVQNLSNLETSIRNDAKTDADGLVAQIMNADVRNVESQRVRIDLLVEVTVRTTATPDGSNRLTAAHTAILRASEASADEAPVSALLTQETIDRASRVGEFLTGALETGSATASTSATGLSRLLGSFRSAVNTDLDRLRLARLDALASFVTSFKRSANTGSFGVDVSLETRLPPYVCVLRRPTHAFAPTSLRPNTGWRQRLRAQDGSGSGATVEDIDRILNVILLVEARLKEIDAPSIVTSERTKRPLTSLLFRRFDEKEYGSGMAMDTHPRVVRSSMRLPTTLVGRVASMRCETPLFGSTLPVQAITQRIAALSKCHSVWQPSAEARPLGTRALSANTLTDCVYGASTLNALAELAIFELDIAHHQLQHAPFRGRSIPQSTLMALETLVNQRVVQDVTDAIEWLRNGVGAPSYWKRLESLHTDVATATASDPQLEYYETLSLSTAADPLSLTQPACCASIVARHFPVLDAVVNPLRSWAMQNRSTETPDATEVRRDFGRLRHEYRPGDQGLQSLDWVCADVEAVCRGLRSAANGLLRGQSVLRLPSDALRSRVLPLVGADHSIPIALDAAPSRDDWDRKIGVGHVQLAPRVRRDGSKRLSPTSVSASHEEQAERLVDGMEALGLYERTGHGGAHARDLSVRDRSESVAIERAARPLASQMSLVGRVAHELDQLCVRRAYGASVLSVAAMQSAAVLIPPHWLGGLPATGTVGIGDMPVAMDDVVRALRDVQFAAPADSAGEGTPDVQTVTMQAFCDWTSATPGLAGVQVASPFATRSREGASVCVNVASLGTAFSKSSWLTPGQRRVVLAHEAANATWSATRLMHGLFAVVYVASSRVDALSEAQPLPSQLVIVRRLGAPVDAPARPWVLCCSVALALARRALGPPLATSLSVRLDLDVDALGGSERTRDALLKELEDLQRARARPWIPLKELVTLA